MPEDIAQNSPLFQAGKSRLHSPALVFHHLVVQASSVVGALGTPERNHDVIGFFTKPAVRKNLLVGWEQEKTGNFLFYEGKKREREKTDRNFPVPFPFFLKKKEKRKKLKEFF